MSAAWYRRYSGLCCCLAMLGGLLWARPVQAVDFSGPALFEVSGPALSALGVRVAGSSQDYMVVGTGTGFLTLNRYNPAGQFYSVLQQRVIGGEIVEIIPWQDGAAQQAGIVVATVNPDRVMFYEVNGAVPYFVEVADIALSEDPAGVAFVGSFESGAPDLAVSLPGVDRIAFLGLENGQWGIMDEVDSGDQPTSVVSIDLDGDQVQELVVAQTGPLSGTLGVFRRQPAGAYEMQTVTLPGVLPSQVSVFDMDADGRDELFVGRADAEQAVIYGTVTGSLVEQGRVDYTINAETLLMISLSDGVPVMVVASGAQGLVEVLAWRDEQWSQVGNYYPGCSPYNLSVADLDGDGLLDLVALDGPGEVFSSMIGNTDPGFSGFPAVSLGAAPGAFVREDFDGDGRQDLLVTHVNQTGLSFFKGTSDGTIFSASQSLELGFVPGAIQLANLDADAGLELLVVDVVVGDLVTYEYSPAVGLTLLSRTSVGKFPHYFIVADLDADQNKDVVLLTRDESEVTILFGDGQGAVLETVVTGYANPAVRIVSIDLNADGLLDLAATDNVNRVWTMLNSGGRQFGQQAFVNAGQGVFSMAAGDLDGDLDDDLVVANREARTLTFFENDGSGVLVRRIGGHAVPGSPTGLLLADINADGRQDVILNQQSIGALSMVLGVSDWLYSPADNFFSGPAVIGFDIADLNLDGVLDVLALDQSLQLGLTLLNGDPDIVAVAPTAVRSQCQGDQVTLRVRPDRPGSWSLELGQGGYWWPVMSNGQSAVGVVAYDAGAWVLQIPIGQIESRLQSGGAQLEARLSVGDGANRESEVWAVDYGCLDFEGAVPVVLQWHSKPSPNPFNPRVQARFTLGQSGYVSAGVYDLAGRLVARLAADEYTAGEHILVWDGRGRVGSAGAGVYFLRVQTNGGILNQKVTLVK